MSFSFSIFHTYKSFIRVRRESVIHSEVHLINPSTYLPTHPSMDIAQDPGHIYPSPSFPLKHKTTRPRRIIINFPNTSPHNHPPPGTSTNINSNNDYTNRLRRHLPHHHLYPSRPLPPNLPLQLLPPLRLARPQRRVDRPVPRRRRHPPRTKDGAGTGR